jgi:2-hydroxy-6-oxonona-2,4-dienedioate hydrolase
MRAGLTTIGLATASALGAAALYRRYRREMNGIAQQLSAAGKVAHTPLGTIEYATRGEGEPVLVIHGAGGGFDQGLALADDLFGPEFRIIAPSRFGYLGTPLPAKPSSPAQADAHAALLDALQVDRAIVVGVSAGAPSAIEMALRHPGRVAALILIVPRAYAPNGPEIRAPIESGALLRAVMSGIDLPFWLATKVARASVVRFLGVPPEVEAQAPPDERERVTGIIRRILPLSRRIVGLRNEIATEIRQWPLERIAVPTLVVSSVDDLYHTLPAARFTAEEIPGAELITLKSGGHLLVERGKEVRGAVASFLRRRRTPVQRAA